MKFIIFLVNLSFINPLIVLYKGIMELFCRHDMRFWDMKFYMDNPNSPHYTELNNKVWNRAFCECQKCGKKYRMSLAFGKFGDWERSDFETTNKSYILVDIYEPGYESIRQKRDKKINDIIND